jgi:GT2 family glycosyltransferase
MNPSIALSVVIVNYKTPALALDLLASLKHYMAQKEIEVIIIDNASGDDSVARIQAAHPNIRVVANTENVLFSAGYSQGVALARGEYVIALNSDMVVQGDALAQMLAQMQANPRIGAATTTMYFLDGRLQLNGCRFTPFWFLILNYSFLAKIFPQQRQKANAWLWYANWDRRTAQAIDVLPGSCILARRDVWQKVGGFDARMKMYFSDDYLSRAVAKLGLERWYLPSDGIIHLEGATAKQMSVWALDMYMRDLLIYARLVYGWWRAALLAMLIFPTWMISRWRAQKAAPDGAPPQG